MFGYITINQPEIKFKDYYRFRSYYCGLCSGLKSEYGNTARISLGYDMTFLAVLLSGLYDSDTVCESFRCIAHPFRKRMRRTNEFTAYAADMNILLTYYKCLDDWSDEKKYTRWLYARLIRKKAARVAANYPEKNEKIKLALKRQSEYEQSEERNFDLIAGCFGDVLSEIFAYRNDMWEKHLRRMGFFMGKYIYLLDAYEDIFDDVEKGCYNSFIDIYQGEDFDEKVSELLKMMISEAADEFEMLPVDENMEILRNIIYSGVWRKFELIQMKRRQENQNKDNDKKDDKKDAVHEEMGNFINDRSV